MSDKVPVYDHHDNIVGYVEVNELIRPGLGLAPFNRNGKEEWAAIHHRKDGTIDGDLLVDVCEAYSIIEAVAEFDNNPKRARELINMPIFKSIKKYGMDWMYEED